MTTVTIRKEPTEADLKAVIEAARKAVFKVAGHPRVLGQDEIDRIYVGEVWAAVAARAIREKSKRGRK